MHSTIAAVQSISLCVSSSRVPSGIDVANLLKHAAGGKLILMPFYTHGVDSRTVYLVCSPVVCFIDTTAVPLVLCGMWGTVLRMFFFVFEERSLRSREETDARSGIRKCPDISQWLVFRNVDLGTSVSLKERRSSICCAHTRTRPHT